MFHFRGESEVAQAVMRVVLRYVLARHSMIFSECSLMLGTFDTETVFKLCSIEPGSRAALARGERGERRAARPAEWRGGLRLSAGGRGLVRGGPLRLAVPKWRFYR